MSVGKRLFDVARANVTDFIRTISSDDERELLDGEVEVSADDSAGARAGRQARQFKDAAEEAWERAYQKAQEKAGGSFVPPGVDREVQMRKWYRVLELEPGAGPDEIRSAYRKMMRKYHPDRYASSPEKYEAATEVARKITDAYNGLKETVG